MDINKYDNLLVASTRWIYMMGTATPANNHKIDNANDYGPSAILATTRLSNFEVKLSTTV